MNIRALELSPELALRLLDDVEEVTRTPYTDADLEKHGDAVLMTWRNWVRLRAKLSEMHEDADRVHPLDPVMRGGYRYALWEIMLEMDETQP